jgi:hypothetical protein
VIRIVLLGRTGNNLFQYALGRVLAKKHHVPLVLDASWFNREGWSEVSHFLNLPLKAKVVRRFSLGSRALRNLAGKHHWEYLSIPVLRESTSDQSFDRRFLEAPRDCMLFGYFQSPLYFQCMAAVIRSEILGLLSLATESDAGIREKISTPGSVAVHVRRTDFLDIPAHQVCGADYYRDAMDMIRATVTDPKFYIFSDDPDWCRAEFTRPDQEVIHDARHAPNPLHDMYLMSLAAHHIIVNSSYSWWAAWLGEKPGQQVMMPDRWFASGINAPISEKAAPHWTVVPC